MQTFLPYPSFAESAMVLDYRRLGKQRVETKQILSTLFHGGGWWNHPAVQMWKGHERALCHYGIAMCEEWETRGYRDHCKKFFLDILGEGVGSAYDLPPWWGGKIHASHRSNLLRKDPIHYGRFGWAEHAYLPYYWPTKQNPAVYRPARRARKQGALG